MKIRVFTTASIDGYSRITEVEAWGNEAPPPRVNFAVNGSSSASSTYNANYPASSTINGDRRGLNWLGHVAGWAFRLLDDPRTHTKVVTQLALTIRNNRHRL